MSLSWENLKKTSKNKRQIWIEYKRNQLLSFIQHFLLKIGKQVGVSVPIMCETRSVFKEHPTALIDEKQKKNQSTKNNKK